MCVHVYDCVSYSVGLSDGSGTTTTQATATTASTQQIISTQLPQQPPPLLHPPLPVKVPVKLKETVNNDFIKCVHTYVK